MRIITICIALLLITPLCVLAQQNEKVKPAGSKPVYFEKTIPLKDKKDPVGKYLWKEDFPKQHAYVFPETMNPYKYLIDPVVQDFQGMGDPAKVLIAEHAMNNPSYSTVPDTQGDVGPNHYYHSVNGHFIVMDKAGKTLYGPVQNMILWQNFPSINTTYGDPITIYDQLADRWLTSIMAAESGGPPYYELIAVSETGDPLGSWYAYAYELEGLPDYPKFGLWHNAYYWSANVYNMDIGEWIGAAAFALERDKVLAGDSTAMMLRFQTHPLGGSIYKDPFSFLPSNLQGTPQDFSLPNYFMYFKDNAWGFPDDFLSLWECYVDWNDTSNCYFAEVAQLQTEPFDANVDNFTYITQPDPAYKLQSLCNRLMFRLDFRHFDGYNAMVTNHTVDCDGSDHAGIRWYELRDYGSGWTIYQQGTYAPDQDHRWMGSASIDSAGNIALGYSVSGDSTYPSIRATGRRIGDSPGLMTIPEFSLMEGLGSQTSSSNRWGDYTCMSTDPVDGYTFWYVNEYYSYNSTSSWRTMLAGFYLTSDSGMHTLVEPDTLFFSTSQNMSQGLELKVINPNPVNASVTYNDPSGMFNGIEAGWYANTPDPAPYFINSLDTFSFEIAAVFTDLLNLGDYAYDTMLVITSLDTHYVIVALADSLITGPRKQATEPIRALEIRPNPCRDMLNVSFKMLYDESLVMELVHLQGRSFEVYSNSLIRQGEHFISLSLSEYNLPQGIYFLSLRSSSSINSQKVLILR